jgi:hypothetical protein
MGLRVRLKAGYDTSALSPQARTIAEALKHYGMILADNGSPWYITGAATRTSTTTSCTSSTSSPAATSRSSTRPRSSTDPEPRHRSHGRPATGAS